jgi:hypothetical protein
MQLYPLCDNDSQHHPEVDGYNAACQRLHDKRGYELNAQYARRHTTRSSGTGHFHAIVLDATLTGFQSAPANREPE